MSQNRPSFSQSQNFEFLTEKLLSRNRLYFQLKLRQRLGRCSFKLHWSNSFWCRWKSPEFRDQKSWKQHLSLNNFKVTFVVSINNRSESLLSGSVPDLQLDDFIVDFDGLEPEINSNRNHVVFIELVIGKSEEQRGFTDGTVTDHYKLEKEVVLLIFHISIDYRLS